jgi:hypothetical protein
MQNRLFRKSLVIGIIILFVGACVIPSISGNIEKINNLPSAEEISLNTFDSDLVGWWSFDEGSGTTVHDYSGNGNDGIIYGATWTTDTPCDAGYALSFDGSGYHGDHINIIDTSDFVFANQDLTFTAWVLIVDNADLYRGFIYLGGAEDYKPCIILAKARKITWEGRIYIQVYSNQYPVYSVARSILNGENLPKYEWLFLTSVVDYPNSVKLYINAEFQDSDSLVEFDMSEAELLRLWIGASAWGDGKWHKGLIDEVRIYDKALTKNEIEFLYNNPGNQPPNKPSKPSGRIHGRMGVEYSYTTSTTDPEGFQVYYMWDWGDGSFSDWLGPYDSGLTVSASHSWSKGSYNIRVKAKDDAYSGESDWSDSLIVTMPRNRAIQNTMFLQFLEQFPILQQLLQRLGLK